jgi:5-methyltetrahydrofolate--homocysteine methyltransferase
LVKDHETAVIGLTIDDDGISTDPEKRLAIAEKIVNKAVQMGIPAEDIVIDPLVMAIGSDNQAAIDTLRTIELIREKIGSNIALGASNVSFGMPDRHSLNQSFMTLAILAGANCMITDPGRLGMTVRATEFVLGRDDFGRRFLGLYRNQEKLRKD